jgi:hypothetical protein
MQPIKTVRFSRRNLLKAFFSSPLAALFAGRAKAGPNPDARFRCCANCRHYVPPRHTAMLDGPPSGYCRHPNRVGSRYIMDSWSVSEAGLYREPGEGCDDWFEGNVREDH